MSQPLIRRALESPLKTWADAQSPAIAIAFQNAAFTPPAGRYLRTFLLPATTEFHDLGGQNRSYSGIWQVSICMPLNTGAGAAEALVQSITALYPTTTPLVVSGLLVYITQPLGAMPAIQEQDRYVVPCSLAYRAETYS